ncbi:TPA: acyltransferase [Vibrio cholerae]
MLKKINKIYLYIRCIPKTIFFNFYYLPFFTAIKLPILISHRTSFRSLGGKIILTNQNKFGKIKLGFGQVQSSDAKYSRFIWNLSDGGIIHLGSKVKIGTGCKLTVSGHLIIGDGCNFTGECSIICQKRIQLGTNCLISWQTLIMDCDMHQIKDHLIGHINPDKEIIIGNDIWICSRVTILKGVNLNSNSVVSSGSHVTSSFEENVIIGGNPAKKIGSMENKKFIH